MSKTQTRQSIDLRTAARALLASDEPLAIAPTSLARIRAIARADSPIVLEQDLEAAAAEEPAALVRRGGPSSRIGSVAVVGLQGIITPRGSWLSLLFGGSAGGLQGFRAAMAEAMGDEDVNAIVIDVHSPGGLIGLVPETAAELRGMAGGDKPIVAVANTLTASAAYWIAAQADEFVVTPSGSVGSIGVYLVHEDWSGFNEAFGVDPTYISAGRFKVEGHPDAPLEDEARDAMQANVDDLYGLFVSDVAKGRGVTPKAVRDGYGEGRVLYAGRAVEAGLADRVASIDDVIGSLNGKKRRRSSSARAGAVTSDPSATLRASDTPEPNAPAEVAEEVRARIAELAGSAPRHI